MERKTVLHTFAPVYDARSRVLLLGTMPSPKSRENGFYYSHPRNRFWPVLGLLLGEAVPLAAEEKARFALRHGIALWDVLRSCEIAGAEDASIRNPVVNDIGRILLEAPVQAVFATGGKAAALYQKYCQMETGAPVTALPSTSPANARMDLAALADAYRVILKYL